ncbi:MAG: RagB/SusD family nutrient uptake outer membrane protein [Chitinophagaceae bacterium]|nr:RagB/SusD family nutrient uptake outer membrane protein [Chitinophagaceae bacterium]
MKKIAFTILVIFVICGTGCTKRLVSKDYSEINPSIFPNSREDIQALVNACYYPLRGSWWDGINGQTERGLIWMDNTTEILVGKYGSQQKLSLLNYTPTDVEGVTYFYDNFYNKISRMTLTIDQIQNSSLDEEVKKAAIAEVRCARGLLCYNLFDLYGPIVVAPLEVLKNPLVEEPLARLSNEEMVAFIEADLTEAAKDLPAPAAAEYGRFSKALAKMVLIRLYLHEKQWAKVRQVCDEIIAYNYFSLSNDYVGLWSLDGAKKSKEVIWAIPCNYEGTSESSWQMYALPQNYAPLGGYQTVQSTWWFYDSFEPADARKTMLITQYTGTDGIVYSRTNPGNVMDLGPIPLKVNPDDKRTTALSTVDIIVYRYADVLLSKAEAIANEGGNPAAEAMELVNIVRRRAQLNDKQLADYNTLNAFNDLLLTERSHEFWCENGQYRADLIRHGKFLERARIVKHATTTEEFKVVLPFSLKTVSEGKGKFIQNQGYN